MMAAFRVSFPSLRVLPGWWRQLAPLKPDALWIGHPTFHAVEALARHSISVPFAPLHQLLLKGLDLPGEKSFPGLGNLFGLDPQPLLQTLNHFQKEGLADLDSTSGWQVTPLGREALTRHAYSKSNWRRTAFHFVETGTDLPPRFIPLLGALPIQPAPQDALPCDFAWLRTCLLQNEEWRRDHQFPETILDILAPAGSAADDSWQQILVDRPWRQPTVFVRRRLDKGGDCLECFALNDQTWEASLEKPYLRLNRFWQEDFPRLAVDPPLDLWRQAWMAWCQPRGFPGGEADCRRLERRDHGLRITASRKLMDRLRSQRSDALKGEAWLLAGTGAFRAAAVLEIVGEE